MLLARELDEITERAIVGLKQISDALEADPGTKQTRSLVKFLAGVYSGNQSRAEPPLNPVRDDF